MIKKAFVIYDVKSATYSHMQFFSRVEEAQRAFAAGANDKECDIYNFAEDYSLWEIGSFDDSNGLFTALSTPVLVCLAVNASVQHKDFYAKYTLRELGDSPSLVMNS